MASTMSYTKGPWAVSRSANGTFGIVRKDQGYVVGYAVKEADATLMTASPELLEAARHFTDCDFDSQGRAVIRVKVEAIEALRVAIAKAEGQ